MLVEFSVENYRSFKDKATLSMVASPDRSHPENLVQAPGLEKDRLVRSAAVYGANASGKSNLLMGLDLLRNLVLHSHAHQKGQRLNFTPFRMDKASSSKPTRFRIVFVRDGVRYSYGVSFDAERVIDEHLHSYPKGRQSLVFDRKGTDKYTFTRDKARQRLISEMTLGNVLYLSSSTNLKYAGTAPAFDWFRDDLRPLMRTGDYPAEHFSVRLVSGNKRMKAAMLKALAAADTGIADMSATVRPLTAEEIMRTPPPVRRLILDIHSPAHGPVEELKVRTVHRSRGRDGGDVTAEFDLEEESEGTRRMFVLMGHCLDALENGRVLVVDELDVKLHVVLNLFIVNLFHDPAQNRNGAQLVFATHNTHLLDQEVLRRDQIWFTERDPRTGASELYSLVEFSPRKDKDLERGYLAGRYGALPFVGDQRILH